MSVYLNDIIAPPGPLTEERRHDFNQINHADDGCLYFTLLMFLMHGLWMYGQFLFFVHKLYAGVDTARQWCCAFMQGQSNLRLGKQAESKGRLYEGCREDPAASTSLNTITQIAAEKVWQ